MTKIDLGRISPTYRGDYDSAVSYNELDIVYDDTIGKSFIAKQASKGKDLPVDKENEYWGIIAKQGEPGEPGKVGPAGPQGKQGTMGPSGEQGPKGEDGKDAVFNSENDYTFKGNVIFNHKLKYKMISLTIDTYKEIDEEVFANISSIGADVSLCVMVPVTSYTDSNPVPQSWNRIQQYADMASRNNVKIRMIKPHLGNPGDGFKRWEYKPDDYDTFFKKWHDYLMETAKFAEDNNIEIVCIGCEQMDNSDVSHYSYWKNIVEDIKSKYANLVITYAFSESEQQKENGMVISDLLDFIGFNIYPSLTSSSLSDNPPVEELVSNFNNLNYANVNYGKLMYDTYNKYHKPIIITETGCQPYAGAINRTYLGPLNPSDIMYEGIALYMKALGKVFKDTQYISGFAWWHGDLNGPFSFWEKNTETASWKEMKTLIESL